MKNIFKTSYLLIILLAIFSISCSDDDNNQLFDEAPSTRVDTRIEELQSLLLGQNTNGYKAVYFTKNDERGGFTLFMKFNADGTVRQTSDFDSDIDFANSSYEISLGTAVELVFTTRNHITKGTDPETVVEIINTRPAPQGFYGTSVFQYFSNDNGVLTFRDVRNADTAILTLTPTNFTDFDTESIASVTKSLGNRLDFTSSNCATDNVFSTKSLMIDGAEGAETYDLNYDEDTFFAKPSRFDSIGSLEVTEEFGIAFTDDGLQISPVLEINGNTFENFTQNINGDQVEYVSTVNGVSAKILDVPVFPTGEDIDPEVPTIGPNGYLYRPSLGGDPLTSNCFRDEVIGQIQSNVDNLLGPGAFTFYDFIFFFDFNNDSCSNQIAIRFTQNSSGNVFRFDYCYDRARVVNDRLYQNYTAPFPDAFGNGAFLESSLMPLISFFDAPNTTGVPDSNSNGLLYTNEGTFFDAGFNVDGAFTNLDNPSYRVQGLFF